MLSQLSLLNDFEWLDFSSYFPVIQDIDTCSLVYWNSCSKKGITVEPFIHFHCPRPNGIGSKDFSTWWNSPIANSQKFGTYSREDFILFMANKEGSHVDNTLPEHYVALKDGSFTSHITSFEGVNTASYARGLNRACIRTIAHEVLMTLEKNYQEIFIEKYIYPTRESHPSKGEQLRLYGIEMDPKKDKPSTFSPERNKIKESIKNIFK